MPPIAPARRVRPVEWHPIPAPPISTVFMTAGSGITVQLSRDRRTHGCSMMLGWRDEGLKSCAARTGPAGCGP